MEIKEIFKSVDAHIKRLKRKSKKHEDWILKTRLELVDKNLDLTKYYLKLSEKRLNELELAKLKEKANKKGVNK